MQTIINFRSQSFILFSCFFIFSQLSLVQINRVSAQCAQDCNNVLNNTFIGFEAGDSITTGNDNTFVGEAAGKFNTEGSGNSFYGVSAGLNNISGINNSFFGRDAGRNNKSQSNSFFGYQSGQDNSTGNSNSFFGRSAGLVNTIGVNNSFFGGSAGLNSETGKFNSFFGSFSGELTSTGNENSFFGFGAGSAITTGNGNICIGSSAGPQIGMGDIDSSLYINIGRSNDPLIYGQFIENLVRINGSLEVMGSLSPSSSRVLKTDFEDIDPNKVMKSLLNLPIQSWMYKSKPNQRHIGPTAEDFQEAFGIGDGKSIATVDADGVMMASIHALARKIEKLEKENEELKKSLTDLIKAVSDIQTK